MKKFLLTNGSIYGTWDSIVNLQVNDITNDNSININSLIKLTLKRKNTEKIKDIIRFNCALRGNFDVYVDPRILFRLVYLFGVPLFIKEKLDIVYYINGVAYNKSVEDICDSK